MSVSKRVTKFKDEREENKKKKKKTTGEKIKTNMSLTLTKLKVKLVCKFVSSKRLGNMLLKHINTTESEIDRRKER